VNWNTTAVTSSPLTAASGVGYFINTSGGAITVNLPAGVAGAIISLADYTNTWQTNNVTVVPNGSEKIGGIAAQAILSTEGQSVTFVYVDSTEGWKNVQDSTSNVVGNPYILATGGTITTCGNYKIHTFTSPGTFTVSSTAASPTNNVVDYLVVAGGGGGGGSGTPSPSNGGGGGGGAGGYRESSGVASGSYTVSPLGSGVSALPVSVQGYPITVGAGGTGVVSGVGPSGNPSIFSTVTSAGGGGGGTQPPTNLAGVTGGSAGGHGRDAGKPVGTAGNSPPTSPPQGNPGGAVTGTNSFDGGGGGGATSAGGAGGLQNGGEGGNGATSSINGTPTIRAGGGGGGSDTAGDNGGGGPGGGGIAGRQVGGPDSGAAGTVNTGGGGGGSGELGIAGAGGSGIVIIRYIYQ
jgi:hypothetical protein